ncbi:Rossmann-fold NAD(P)-binding domain-containing protein [Chitinimonas naiadis]
MKPLGTVLVAGGSGLVGRLLLAGLANDPGVDDTIVLARRPIPLAQGQRLLQLDFERLADTPLPPVDTVFCTLGTTIRQAGSQAAFRRVDHDYVLALARQARSAGARHFLVVSALGADARSRVFYSRVKGETEQALAALGYPQLSVLRPALLLGEREEFRLGERIAARLGWAMPARYRPIAASDVALAMQRLAHEGGSGVRYIESSALRGIAQSG